MTAITLHNVHNCRDGCRALWPDLWACTLQLHHMLASGALESDMADAKKWTDKLVGLVAMALAVAAEQMATPCEEQLEACSAEIMVCDGTHGNIDLDLVGGVV